MQKKHNTMEKYTIHDKDRNVSISVMKKTQSELKEKGIKCVHTNQKILKKPIKINDCMEGVYVCEVVEKVMYSKNKERS